jgi:hypothetical protein
LRGPGFARSWGPRRFPKLDEGRSGGDENQKQRESHQALRRPNLQRRGNKVTSAISAFIIARRFTDEFVAKKKVERLKEQVLDLMRQVEHYRQRVSELLARQQQLSEPVYRRGEPHAPNSKFQNRRGAGLELAPSEEASKKLRPQQAGV